MILGLLGFIFFVGIIIINNEKRKQKSKNLRQRATPAQKRQWSIPSLEPKLAKLQKQSKCISSLESISREQKAIQKR